MIEKRVYPIYIIKNKESSNVYVPDLNMYFEVSETSLAYIMEKARAAIEIKLNELQDSGSEIPEENSVDYKKKKNEIFTYIDVNPERFLLKTSEDELEKTRMNQMWDVKENVIEFLLNQKIMTLTLTQRKLVNKVMDLANEWPEEVKVLHTNEDGSIYAQMPTNYLKLNRPFRRELTEEEKERNRENLEKGREQKKLNEQKEKRD